MSPASGPPATAEGGTAKIREARVAVEPVVRHVPRPGADGPGLQRRLHPLPDVPQLVLGPLALGRVDPVHEDAGDGTARAPDRLVHEVEDPLLQPAAPPEDESVARPDVRLAGPIHQAEDLEVSLPL